MNQSVYEDDKINYSKFFSGLFSSVAILVLSFLCILNNKTLDLYGAYCLLKVVVPAGVCFWFIGFVMGKKLKVLGIKIMKNKIENDKKAYEIPSMFGSEPASDFDEAQEESNTENT